MALVFTAAALGIFLRGIPKEVDIDSHMYLAMARGEMSEVVQPYANRVLHPLLARGIAALGVENLETVFLGLAAMSLALFALAIAMLVDRRVSKPEFFILMLSPVLCLYCLNIYLSDLFYLALWGFFLVALQRGKLLPAAALLFTMQLTRESTVALAGVVVLAALWKREWKWAVAPAIAVACGMAVVAWLARSAQPNIHNMGGLAYMVTKVFANLSANVCGIIPWSDSYALRFPERYCDAPVWRTVPPAWIPLGGVREIGIYKFDPMAPVWTLSVLLGTFGILPVLLFRWWQRAGWRHALRLPFPLLAILASGVLFYALGVVTGRSAERLVGHGWTAFWVALPLLVCFKTALPDKAKLWSAHAACQWAPVLFARMAPPGGAMWGLLVSLACFGFAFHFSKQQETDTCV